jgi:hypothetical protein
MKSQIIPIVACVVCFLFGGVVFSPPFRGKAIKVVVWLFRGKSRKGKEKADDTWKGPPGGSIGETEVSRPVTRTREALSEDRSLEFDYAKKLLEAQGCTVVTPAPADDAHTLDVEKARTFLKKSGYNVRKQRAKRGK